MLSYQLTFYSAIRVVSIVYGSFSSVVSTANEYSRPSDLCLNHEWSRLRADWFDSDLADILSCLVVRGGLFLLLVAIGGY